MSRKRHKQEHRLGFSDYCRVDREGVVTCAGGDKPELQKLFADKAGKQKHWDRRRNKRGEEYTPHTVNVGSKEWNQYGSPLFTSTKKVHAPSFGLMAAATCPAVSVPLTRMVADAMKRPDDPKLHDTEQAIAKLQQEVPQKCLACYATQNTYLNAETRVSMERRQKWWNSTSDQKIEDTLVDAILHAGDEVCDNKGCTFVPGVQAHRFRAFDSGDFQSPRDIRIWQRVAGRLQGKKVGSKWEGRTRFWFPTTTAEGMCKAPASLQREMLQELKKLHSLPNVVVRPSAREIDSPAAYIPGLGAGTSVVEPTTAHGDTKAGTPGAAFKRGRGEWMKICDRKRPHSCRDHFICGGDCAVCPMDGMCWSKHAPVVYVRHGLKASADRIVNLVRRATGTEAYNPDEPGQKKPVAHLHKEANEGIKAEFVQLLSRMWQGPTDQWEGYVRRVFPQLPGKERARIAKEERDQKRAEKLRVREEKLRLREERRAIKLRLREERRAARG